MTAALHVPLLVSALLFGAFAAAEWRRAPVWGRIHLAVATAFALGAAAYPGMTIKDVLDGAHDGMAYLVGLARGMGIVAALVTVMTRVREQAFR
jgi:hypothetical protein